MSKLKVMRNVDLLKVAGNVLKEPEKFGAHAVQQAQAIVKEEKGVSNAITANVSKYGDTVVTDAEKSATLGKTPTYGKVTVKGVAPLAGMPTAADVNPIGLAQDAWGAISNAKDAAMGAVADRLDVRANEQQPSSKDAMMNVMHGAEMFIPGAVGNAMGAADLLLNKEAPQQFYQGGDVPKDMSQWGQNASVMDQTAPADMSQAPQPNMPGMVDTSGQQLAPVSFSDVAQQQPNLQSMPEQKDAEQAVQSAVSNVNMPQQQQAPSGLPTMPQASADPYMKIATDAQAVRAKHDAAVQKKLQSMLDEGTHIANEIRNGKIDPNAYIGNMSGMDKANTAIGLILSGIGSGMSGQPNMAMDFLQKQIDRDIAGQTANMDKKQNLLHALHQQLGDVAAAQTMFKAIQYDLAAGKIASMAAKSNDPAVHMRAQQAIQALGGQISPAMLQIAQRQAVMKSLGTGEMQPEHAIAFLPMSEHEKSEAYKEIGNIREIDKTGAEVSKALQDLGQLSSLKGRLSSPLQSSKQIEARRAELQSMAHTIFSKTSDNEFKIIADGFAPGLFTSPETLAKQAQIFQSMLQRKRQAPVMTGQGIPLPPPPTLGVRANKSK